ncbi:MAG: UDP-N-acetylmuramoyl-L-alanyl-D-glutamate--2,6-diaminopimelate ligase [Thermoanaerobaculia bacterium]|nr:UDP-N-acetylmuramoyl-L-alanyl-D-glutamate--2,6-diaminopimelate ligase [Thermoanaerobaculia bacterium]
MEAERLFEGLSVVVPSRVREMEITGVQHHSRRVERGDLFVAIHGDRFDGREFLSEAAEAGAVAILGAGDPPAHCTVPWIRADNPRSLLAPLAERVYGRPAEELFLIGVTGTNGKSTMVWLIQAVLEAAEIPCGRLGNMSYSFRDLDLPAERTTPEISDLHRLFRRIRDRGAEAVTLEVSSHALRMGRVQGLTFDIAVFTNLSQEHLDFHRDMEDYFAAKRSLFDQLADDGVGVVNVDDPYGRRLAEGLERVVTFGSGGEVEVLGARLGLGGIRARIETPRGELEVESALRGSYNLTNLVNAVAVGEAMELPLPAIREGISRAGVVPGRMEPVDAGQPFPAFVDYAHTEDALNHLLTTVRRLTGKRILLVFGCGGDRDAGKRVHMGRTAGELADLVIVTSDNPRSEDPLAIIAAVEEGIKASGNERYRILPDRRDAIRRAVSIADGDWTLVVAGKGNETGQEIQDEIYPFSDREEIARAVEDQYGHADDD